MISIMSIVILVDISAFPPGALNIACLCQQFTTSICQCTLPFDAAAFAEQQAPDIPRNVGVVCRELVR